MYRRGSLAHGLHRQGATFEISSTFDQKRLWRIFDEGDEVGIEVFNVYWIEADNKYVGYLNDYPDH